MSDDKSNPPPPTNPGYNYGAVPSTGPSDEAQAMAPPPVQQNYPQDPPPKYEPPKGQDYPPQQYQPQTQYPPGKIKIVIKNNILHVYYIEANLYIYFC